MRALILAPIALLAGCVTTIDEAENSRVVESVTTARPLAQVRDCLARRMVTPQRNPMVTGDSTQTVITVNDSYFGVAFSYTLTAVDGGTRVDVRRASKVLGGMDKGRSCYPA